MSNMKHKFEFEVAAMNELWNTHYEYLKLIERL